jgi:hypothetical protein
MHTAAAFVHHHPAIATVILILAVAYLTHHGRHYRRHRRDGLSVRVSMRGPWHTTISRRF